MATSRRRKADELDNPPRTEHSFIVSDEMAALTLSEITTRAREHQATHPNQDADIGSLIIADGYESLDGCSYSNAEEETEDEPPYSRYRFDEDQRYSSEMVEFAKNQFHESK